jgi:hypothetical protein
MISGLSLVKCYDEEHEDERLRWDYDEETLQIRLHNKPKACLTAALDSDQVLLQKCQADVPKNQQWDFLPYTGKDPEHDEL